jgi:hypothetical protein
MTTELTRYDAACRALAEAIAIDEVKDIRDQAMAMACYARQAKNRDLEADAVELRMRATRRLAEMIAAQKETIGLNVGTRGSRIKGARVDEKPTLAMQGIDKNLAHQARQLGALSEQEFEQKVAETRDAVTTAIAQREPEPKPKQKYKVNPAAAALFANEDQLHAFAHAVNTKAARKFIKPEQHVDLAKELIEGNIRVLAYQPWITDWLRQAGKAQSEIDAAEKDDLYKQFLGYEIRDEVAAAKSATRALVGALLKLEELWKKFPANPFFGDIGGVLDAVINMIRQYRRAAGEHSADEVERKLARLHELEQKTQTQESIIEGLRRELEELRRKLAMPDAMSFPEFQTAIEKYADTVATQRSIIAERDAKIAQLQSENASLRAGAVAPPPADPRDPGPMPASLVRSAAP